MPNSTWDDDLFYVQRKLGSGMFNLQKAADVTGVALTAIYRIRDGATKGPRRTTIQALHTYFKRAAL